MTASPFSPVDPPEPGRDLGGQTAVVTGSSSGIGRAMALEFAAAGADVLVHAGRRMAAAEETAAAVVKMGRTSHAVCHDLCSAKGQDALLGAALAWRPKIDIWVNNAGADLLTGAARQWSFEEKFERLWRLDVLATVRLSRAIGQRMHEWGGGTILNIGWDQAASGMEGDSGELFATAKGAVMAFTRSLAASLAPLVRVNCVAPGWIRTAWGEQASDEWQRRAVEESHLQRWGTPEDVARAARFLVSPAAGFITGQVLPVNGGLRLGRRRE